MGKYQQSAECSDAPNAAFVYVNSGEDGQLMMIEFQILVYFGHQVAM